jgi:tetratricopeptide (TPR) repeat protein
MNASEEPDWQSVERHAVSLIDKGHELQRLGCDKEALASFDKAVTICRAISDKSDPVSLVLAQALDNKGRALMDLKRLAEAIPCFDEAIQVHKEIVRGDGTEQDVRETAISVMNKGLALMRLGRNEEALACFEEALDAFRTCQSGEDIARALANCGDLYTREDRLDEALAAFDESLAMWEAATAYEPDASKGDYAYTLFSKADVLLRLERYDEALDTSGRSIALQRAIVNHVNGPKERKDLAEALNLRGDILNKLGRTNEAQDCILEAAKLNHNTGKP